MCKEWDFQNGECFNKDILCLFAYWPLGVIQRGSAVFSRTRRGERQSAQTLFFIQEVRAAGRRWHTRCGVWLAGSVSREEQAEGQTVSHQARQSWAKRVSAEARCHPWGGFIWGWDRRRLRGQPGWTQGEYVHSTSSSETHHCENRSWRHAAIPLPLPLHSSCYIQSYRALSGRQTQPLAHFTTCCRD